MKNNHHLILILAVLGVFALTSCGTKSNKPRPVNEAEIEVEMEGSIGDSEENEEEISTKKPKKILKPVQTSKKKQPKSNAGGGSTDEAETQEVSDPQYVIGSGTGTLEQAFCKDQLAYKDELFKNTYSDFDSICLLELAPDCTRPMLDLCLESESRYPDDLKAFPGASFKVLTSLDRGTTLGESRKCVCPIPE